MNEFPRTNIEALSVSRLLIGTNWFLGFSHTSVAKDMHIRDTMSSGRIADIILTFMDLGIDTLYGMRPDPVLVEAVEEAQQRSGRKCITIAAVDFPLDEDAQSLSEAERIFDEHARLGVSVCMPHTSTTDILVDRRTHSLPGMEKYLRMIRDRGMIPGLSTHMPETIVYADASGLDVATYVQIYNAAGFLMPMEADWVHRMIIWPAKKPVITIKPLAAGRLSPLVGLAFSWSTIRDIDMICIGTSSPGEASEVVELSLALLQKRVPRYSLQHTRSKESIKPV